MRDEPRIVRTTSRRGALSSESAEDSNRLDDLSPEQNLAIAEIQEVGQAMLAWRKRRPPATSEGTTFPVVGRPRLEKVGTESGDSFHFPLNT